MFRSRSAEPAPFAATPPSPFPQPQVVPTLAPRAPLRLRRLPRVHAQALEVLAHAIEYLADEYAFDRKSKGPLPNADPRLEAMQILKNLNRQIYLSGSEIIPPFERLRRWFLGEST